MGDNSNYYIIPMVSNENPLKAFILPDGFAWPFYHTGPLPQTALFVQNKTIQVI
jgi:hypothetical protein